MSFLIQRRPLKPGSIVRMPNRGQYVICEKISEGGLSLIYSAKTKTNDYPVIIKEFFPANHAHRAKQTLRAEDGTILEKKGRVYPDSEYDADRFEQCLNAFEQEGRLGSSARLNNYQIISFADCGDGYAVLPRWSNDSCSFQTLVKGWNHTPPPSKDRYFTDLGRIRFALTAINSLLSAVSSIHAQGMLHLDISANNVVWAGHIRTSPENGAAFLTDFGCSALMTNGVYPAEYVLSYSKEYAAPEHALKNGNLTCATDMYSVGRLLAFLCFEQRAFYKQSRLKDLIKTLHIPDRHRSTLLTIIEKATAAHMPDRYQTASEMQKAVVELLCMIPANPINPDCNTSFSLHSLKSMLEGSLDTRYSWAHELCDRRGFVATIPDSVHQPIAHISGSHFENDEAFLRAILPDGIFDYLWKQVSDESNKPFVIQSIMSGTYPDEWKDEISNKLVQNVLALPDLFKYCRTLLRAECVFEDAIHFLFCVSGSDMEYFRHCYTECGFEIERAKYKGLALLVIFALLGQDENHGFYTFAQHSPREIRKLLRR